MRRIFLILICIFLLAVPVSAESVVEELKSNTNVSSDGTCQITLTVRLRLEDILLEDLVFPLPAQARDITLNGSGVRAPNKNGARLVDLEDAVHGAGIHTFTIQYSMPDSITAGKNGLTLDLDLLHGFSYPIDLMSFSITLPGAPERPPVFTSTYHQEAVDSLMVLNMEGNTISGEFLYSLQDHESLHMSLQVSETMFPQPVTKQWSLSVDDLIMYGLAVVALIYWLLTMRCLPPRRSRRVDAPEGLTAGEMGCALTGSGIDLPILVVSWARMGYLLIHLDDNGRVTLHKRMEMGNERGDFENRCFHNLFGRRRSIDATGYHFARLYRKASHTVPHVRDYFRRESGNPRIFRLISGAIDLICGISLANAFVADTAWRIILSIFLSIFGLVCTYLIQSGAGTIHLRRKDGLWLGIGASVIWILLSIWAGDWVVGVYLVLTQWLTGLAASYGGRRSDLGRQLMSQILGLRRHMASGSREQLRQTLQSNPDYYYTLAPFAMALGVDKAFAKQFGDQKLPECSFLTTGMDGHLSPAEWNRLLREAVSIMDERHRRLTIDKLLGKA